MLQYPCYRSYVPLFIVQGDYDTVDQEKDDESNDDDDDEFDWEIEQQLPLFSQVSVALFIQSHVFYIIINYLSMFYSVVLCDYTIEASYSP